MKNLQKLLALLLAAAMVLAMVPAASAESRTVTIADEEQFLTFAENCARDTWSLDLTAELTADLDLSAVDWTPVPIFQGTFHGNGHTISGVTFHDKGSKIGLFRTLTASAVVSDLHLEAEIAPDGSACQVGLLAGETYGLIQNCTVSGTVSGQEDVGAVAGLCGEGGRIENCSSTADVSGVTNAGGIVGQNLGTVSGCRNSGSVAADAMEDTPSSVGGIAGLSRGTLENCSNQGTVGYAHLGYNIGGIAGLQSGEIQDCSNTGAIQGRKDVGGIVGQFEPLVDVIYGASPTSGLSDSLGTLLTEMETFVDQVSAMAARGVDGARAVEDALAAIRAEADTAGSQGMDDLTALADGLDKAVEDLGHALDALGNDADDFATEAGSRLQDLLSELDALRRALDGTGNLPSEVNALRNTLDQIRSQVQTVSTELAAIRRDMESVRSYLETVSGLLAQGDLEWALSQPFPSVDFAGHNAAMEAALAKLPGLLTQLNQNWEAISKTLSGQLGADWEQLQKTQAAILRDLQALLDAADTLKKSWNTDVDTVETAVSSIHTLLSDYADTLSSQAQSTVDAIDVQLSIIESQLSGMTDAAGGDTAALHDTCVRMIQSLNEAREAISQLGREPQLTVTDLSADAVQGPGLISGCTVSAEIAGDSNVGGIVGTVSPELGDDPEATFDVGDLHLTSDVTAQLTAVVRGCRFDGAVTVKNDCGGGIAGWCTAGTLTDCAARGTVETGTDYCGGIAGRTRGSVVRCAALVDLTGGSWIGGIAGLGGDLTDCRAMVRADSSGECIGAIAGETEGTLSGNRYLLEEIPGVDGVDYAGTAEGLDFAAFSALDGIPADFLTFSCRFTVDGDTVAEIPFAYGADLDLSQVPQAPQRDGQYGQWPDFPTEHLTRSLVLEAQFETPVSTLSSGGEIPDLLVEGAFSPDAALTAAPMDLPDTGLGKAQKAWSYSVTGTSAETVTLRLRAADLERPAAAIQTDGKWVLAEGTMDGSYLVVEAPASGQVVLLERPASAGWIWGAAAGLAVLLLALVLLRRHRRRAPAAQAAK